MAESGNWRYRDRKRSKSRERPMQEITPNNDNIPVHRRGNIFKNNGNSKKGYRTAPNRTRTEPKTEEMNGCRPKSSHISAPNSTRTEAKCVEINGCRPKSGQKLASKRTSRKHKREEEVNGCRPKTSHGLSLNRTKHEPYSVEVNGCRPKTSRGMDVLTAPNVDDFERKRHDLDQSQILKSSDRKIDSKKKTMGFPFLKDLMDKDPTYIVIELTKRKPVLQDCIERTAKEMDFLEIFLKVVAKAYESKTTPKQLIGLFDTLKETHFFDSVGLFLIDLSSKIEDGLVDKANIEQIIQNLLSIALAQVQRNPSSLFVLSRIITMINQVAEGLNKTGPIDERIFDDLQQLKELRKQKENVKSSSKNEQQPPDDFRAYPVSPCKAELLRYGRPFLRQNKIDEQYDDIDHYLDVQFRLLREDFVGPLREGLTEYLDWKQSQGKQNQPKKRKYTDIKIYENVTVLSPVLTDNGLCYKLQLDMTTGLRNINWKQSKRLIFGSLVCVADINQDHLHMATVVERDDIAAGFLTVHFVDESLTCEDVLYRSFSMAESSAYYESYKHVLAGMQCLQPGDLPFENYILGKIVDVDPPSYLSTAETYDLRPLVDQDYVVHGESRLSSMELVIPGRSTTSFSTRSKPAKSVCVRQLKSWPKRELLNLDESQYKAVQAALTKEFAIVQGPPGTGKTYIGLQIARTLLHNRSAWSGSGKTVQPMLIVCYTNHALDQFLEGIVKFFKGDVIRVGGRSSSKVLEEFNIRQARRKPYGPRTSIGIMQRNKKQVKEDLEKQLKVFRRITRSLELFRSEVIHERALKTVMGRLYNSLIDGMPNKKSRFKGTRFSYMFKWLGITELQRECKQEAQQMVDLVQDRYIEVNDDQEQRLRTWFVHASEDVKYGLDEESVNTIRQDVIAFHAKSNPQTQFRDVKDHAIYLLYCNILRSRLARMISRGDIMSEEEASGVTKLWRLDRPTKWKLYRYWVQRYCMEELKRIDELRPEFEEVSERYQEALNQEDKEIMKHASVIGMTTSGAARYQSVLKDVAPTIVIVEEAAEVLEAHIAMSLSKSCRHLILIGDHMQLRPNPNVYLLAKKYNLDISLFERMVKAGMEYSCLKLQHRMRPQISAIVRHIYPNLEDHESVKMYPLVKGVSTNLHLINHGHMESRDNDGKSYSNPHEAEFAVALCRYLILQGYQKQQITILTTYTAQLFVMKRLLPKTEFEGVHVTVVDNYQGEENDIVILSLVRSNQDDKIGFLKTENRICVALSRAKIGFYILGNFDHLAVHSELWKNITDDMRERGHFSNTLKLYCQNHPDDKGIEASSPSDFKDAPEGGCVKICEARLKCGHKCEKHCHILDPTHSEYQCMKPCTKSCDAAGHPCKARCYEECPPCYVKVKKIVPQCKHEQEMMCKTDPNQFTCLVPCRSLLECGHRCKDVCGREHTKKCMVMIDHTWPCGHSAKIHCWEKEAKPCPEPCESILECEHKCPGTCGSCFKGRVHVQCQNRCTRNLVCGHQCGSNCNTCLPCTKPCRNRCIHSKCQLLCGETCQPCKEPCAWKCKHFKCTKLCFEACNRPKCNKPCPIRIKRCKHECIGLCGEPCPKLCRVCDAATVTEILFGDEDSPDARFVLLEDCNHIIEYKAMDKYMDTKADEGEITLKCCPKCKTPIQKSLRYGNLINDVLETIERVKVAMRGDANDIKAVSKSIIQKLPKPPTPLGGRLTLSSRRSQSLSLSEVLDRNSRDHRVSDPYDRLRSSLEIMVNGPVLSVQEVTSFENRLSLANAWKKVEAEMERECSIHVEFDQFLSLQETMMAQLLTPTVWLSEQRIKDFSLELKRCQMLVKFCKITKKVKEVNKTKEATAEIELLKDIILRDERYSGRKEVEAKKCIKKLVELTKIEGLGITEQERLDIVKAVGLSKGHWFKCPNNHIYAIGECGGANERGKCPECNTDIGGLSHRLADGNQVAKEMDGAQFAAYSEEANNMANFDLNNLY